MHTPLQQEATLPAHDVLVGRRPILDGALVTHAYQLLVEHPEDLPTILAGGLVHRIAAGRPVFLAQGGDVLARGSPLAGMGSGTVVECSPVDTRQVRDLKERGYTPIACDGGEPPADLAALGLVVLPADGNPDRAHALRTAGCRLLADDVNTHQEFETCRSLGFDLFRGSFLLAPAMGSSQTPTSDRATLVRLVAELQNPDCDFERLQEIVSGDTTLSYMLLRHINSALYAMPRRIRSLRETLVYLGLQTVKNLACLLLMTRISDGPHERIAIAMMRARTCERLGSLKHGRGAHRFFTAGLLSVMDAVTGDPLHEVVRRLSLSPDLREALLHGRGEMGAALQAAKAYEAGRWEEVHSAPFGADRVRAAWLDAVDWVSQAEDEMAASAA